MIYFYTAYLPKCYVREPGWEAVRDLARRHERIACSASSFWMNPSASGAGCLSPNPLSQR